MHLHKKCFRKGAINSSQFTIIERTSALWLSSFFEQIFQASMLSSVLNVKYCNSRLSLFISILICFFLLTTFCKGPTNDVPGFDTLTWLLVILKRVSSRERNVAFAWITFVVVVVALLDIFHYISTLTKQ